MTIPSLVLIFLLPLVSSYAVIRPLGSYETLLSRKIPNGDSVALSHGAAVLLKGVTSKDALISAVAACIDKHPSLSCYIARDASNDQRKTWFKCDDSSAYLARQVVTRWETVPSANFDDSWKAALERSVNGAEFLANGPLWKLESIVDESNERSAWVFCMNHGMDDQQSVNIIVQDMLTACSGNQLSAPMPFPPSVEEACAPQTVGINTALWGAYQLGNLLAMPVQFPQSLKGRSEYCDPSRRSTILDTFTLSAERVTALRLACRARGVTVTQALGAAMLCATSDTVSDGQPRDLDLRFLLAVGLRSFGVSGADDFTGGTVACAGGAVDFIVRVPPTAPDADTGVFWDLARRCREKAKWIFDRKFVSESVRLFDFGMQYAQVLPIVDKDAQSSSLGRGFSCGVSNVGVCDFSSSAGAGLEVEEVFYGTSHARNGVLCQLSVETVKTSGTLCGCLQMTDPLTTRDEQEAFRERLLSILAARSED